jgi:hypothetical protein
MNAQLLDPMTHLLTQMSLAFPDPRPRAAAVELGLGLLCAQGPKTITAGLAARDHAHQDWSEAYRLFSRDQCVERALFEPILRPALAQPTDRPALVLACQDDTLLRKSGKKTFGTVWARDPLGPHFQVNLVRGQRFVQTSLLLQPGGTHHPWRALPVNFTHAPVPKIPAHATEQEKAALKELRKKHRLSLVALEQVRTLRAQIDATPGGYARTLVEAVDGSYANATYLRALPARTVVVARLRKDAQLRAYLPPGQRVGARKYGDFLPTPEQYLREESVPWQAVDLFVAGQVRTVHYKVIEKLCWPRGTGPEPVRLILIKAAGYRLRQGSPLLYREPAFLLDTALTLPVQDLIVAYLARWEVEVNFRDEKSVVGVGQAQVRVPQAVQRAPQFLVACYAALLWCSITVFGDRRTEAFGPLPRWRRQAPLRPSIQELLRLLRREVAEAAKAEPSTSATRS